MPTKPTSKNQMRLSKSSAASVGSAAHFDGQARAGEVIRTPVCIPCADALRAKLAEVDLDEADVVTAVAWTRRRR